MAGRRGLPGYGVDRVLLADRRTWPRPTPPRAAGPAYLPVLPGARPVRRFRPEDPPTLRGLGRHDRTAADQHRRGLPGTARHRAGERAVGGPWRAAVDGAADAGVVAVRESAAVARPDGTAVRNRRLARVGDLSAGPADSDRLRLVGRGDEQGRRCHGGDPGDRRIGKDQRRPRACSRGKSHDPLLLPGGPLRIRCDGLTGTVDECQTREAVHRAGAAGAVGQDDGEVLLPGSRVVRADGCPQLGAVVSGVGPNGPSCASPGNRSHGRHRGTGVASIRCSPLPVRSGR
jgi:hypothetical protein